MQTPGHTDESVSYVITGLALGGSPVVVFIGDTLFVNDVGWTAFTATTNHADWRKIYSTAF